MATPVIASAASLLKALDNSLDTPLKIKNIIINTADETGIQ